MANKIILPQLAWHGGEDLALSLPESWRVDIYNMVGYDRPRLKPAQIKKAVGRPIGMEPLQQYARGKKEVVILFDDMARVTRVAEIVPYILAELAAAGIADKQIRFIAACGCHGALSRSDFAKKLGESVLARFPVYNHNPFANCVYAGTTTRGTRVCINAEVMKCDLKIGIGSIVPHIMAGFGGGAKIVLPGAASFETAVALHSSPGDRVSGMGVLENNSRRQDIDEAAEMVGLDMKIDAIINARGETVALYAGAPAPAYDGALFEAKKHYLTPAARDKDIVIANTFAKASEAVSGLLIAFPAVSRKGGDIVLIANAPEGQAPHYLMGPFGNSLGGELQLRMDLPPQVNRVIIYNEYPELSGKYYIKDTEKVVMLNDWDEVLKLLQKSHGTGAKVAVYPSADIQYV